MFDKIERKIKKFINKNFRFQDGRKSIKQIAPYFSGLKGLEIGGPTKMFREDKILPIYAAMAGCDGVNFSADTVWTGDNDTSDYVINGEVRGRKYILDASDLSSLPRNAYDFVLSSNNLEHMANPLKAIEQWLGVLKPQGLLLLVLPRKESNFDHRRPIVTFEHLEEDYRAEMKEDDLTHLDEVLELHDLKLDRMAGSIEEFRERGLKNI